MTNAELLTKIKAEIERRFSEYNHDSSHHIQAAECASILDFLDTLEEKSEKPNNHEGLKNVVESYYIEHRHDVLLSPYNSLMEFAKLVCEWQKDKDTRDMYMSDNRHFQKVYELGRKDKREQMMKEAVEGEVFYNPYPTISLDDCKDYDLKDGDKVKLIVCKED